MATRIALSGALVSCGLGGAALERWYAAEPASESAARAVQPSVTPEATSSRTDGSTPGKRRTAPSAVPKKPSEPAKPPGVPTAGPGTFTTAQASGSPVGSGPLHRYRVQVEDGIEISAEAAAREIQKILAHQRSWGAHGRGSFQLVTSDADFVIKIATPATADRLCLAQGFDTGGELNCETLEGVVVNLRRWLLGSPQFDGAPAQYRHLIINHEVGHEIGVRAHMGCPGRGQLAPVMMQQIKGLNGCLSNAWPYDKNGTYITGPTVG
ncbi:DUF3152 domain-containing protein [Streptomyces sp. NPDC057445]|uniref:DUF3152 domain-containing protein n=1 Tax=Streptomyces sp. NPDC057445 TaxID=3346136 RepID=UPI003679CFDA